MFHRLIKKLGFSAVKKVYQKITDPPEVKIERIKAQKERDKAAAEVEKTMPQQLAARFKRPIHEWADDIFYGGYLLGLLSLIIFYAVVNFETALRIVEILDKVTNTILGHLLFLVIGVAVGGRTISNFNKSFKS